MNRPWPIRRRFADEDEIKWTCPPPLCEACNEELHEHMRSRKRGVCSDCYAVNDLARFEVVEPKTDKTDEREE